MVTSLTALLLQIKVITKDLTLDMLDSWVIVMAYFFKSLGQESGSTVNSFELQALTATMAEIRNSLKPENFRVFQENVEIHLTHIEKSLCSATEADIADSITTIAAQ